MAKKRIPHYVFLKNILRHISQLTPDSLIHSAPLLKDNKQLYMWQGRTSNGEPKFVIWSRMGFFPTDLLRQKQQVWVGHEKILPLIQRIEEAGHTVKLVKRKEDDITKWHEAKDHKQDLKLVITFPADDEEGD